LKTVKCLNEWKATGDFNKNSKELDVLNILTNQLLDVILLTPKANIFA
jgi:hypothetical protein